jgi:hypothetical protein
LIPLSESLTGDPELDALLSIPTDHAAAVPATPVVEPDPTPAPTSAPAATTAAPVSPAPPATSSESSGGQTTFDPVEPPSSTIPAEAPKPVRKAAAKKPEPAPVDPAVAAVLAARNAAPVEAPRPAKPAPVETPEQARIRELEHQLALQRTKEFEAAPDQEIVASGETKLTIHFLIDGFTACGRVWMRGQELEFDIPGLPFEDTKDRNGETWLAFDDAAQMEHYGKVYFRRGPWPGSGYEDPAAGAAAHARRRAAPVLGIR